MADETCRDVSVLTEQEMEEVIEDGKVLSQELTAEASAAAERQGGTVDFALERLDAVRYALTLIA
jgi:hypothetical protein